jgi:hypothetical protein
MPTVKYWFGKMVETLKSSDRSETALYLKSSSQLSLRRKIVLQDPLGLNYIARVCRYFAAVSPLRASAAHQMETSEYHVEFRNSSTLGRSTQRNKHPR